MSAPTLADKLVLLQQLRDEAVPGTWQWRYTAVFEAVLMDVQAVADRQEELAQLHDLIQGQHWALELVQAKLALARAAYVAHLKQLFEWGVDWCPSCFAEQQTAWQHTPDCLYAMLQREQQTKGDV